MEVLSKAVIGQGFGNILDILPLDEKINRVIAVLKEVRFDKHEARRFQPGKVQFVFALSADIKNSFLILLIKVRKTIMLACCSYSTLHNGNLILLNGTAR